MARLQLNPEETITRKEYLKRKKQQLKGFNRKSKLSYLLILALIVLAVYVFIQFYFYNKKNNFKYVAGDAVNKQKVYNMYYVTEGYTYDPVYSLNLIRTDGFNDKLVFQNSGMHSIISKDEYIYGIKNDVLCRFSKSATELEVLVNEGVQKFTLANSRVYYIVNNKLNYIDINSKEKKELAVDNVSEVLIDDNYIYTAKSNKSKKILVRYNLDGGEEKILADNVNVSYIIKDDSTIYFVNKDDANKIYSVGKDGGAISALGEFKGISDNGNIKEIDGDNFMFVSEGNLYYVNPDDNNTLWKINLEDKKSEKVIHSSVQILQNVENTVFFKVKNEMGVYLYNFNTKFMSKITNRNVSEFSIDGVADNTNELQTEKISKN